MSESEKTINLHRLREIIPLLLAGTDLSSLRRHAAENGWDVSRSELSAYVRRAHKRLARGTKRKPGILQADSIKTTAVRQALRTFGIGLDLKGSSEPQSTELAPDGTGSLYRNTSDTLPLTRRERVVRQLAALAENDQVGLRLVEHATPYRIYRWKDTTLPIQLLNTLTLIYVSEQIERAAMVANSLFCSSLEPDDRFWDFIGLTNAYLYRIGQEGWRQFTEGLGIDGQYLVRANYQGIMLEAYGEKICNIAPSQDEVQALFAGAYHSVEKIVTAEALARGWREDFLSIFEEPKRT